MMHTVKNILMQEKSYFYIFMAVDLAIVATANDKIIFASENISTKLSNKTA